MTIEKGTPWGRTVGRPPGLRIVTDDASLAAALTDGSGRPTAPSGGDLHRTVGGRELADRAEVLELPIDLLDVRLDDDRRLTACAHVVVHAPAVRGGRWRQDVVIVMNAEFCGRWHVAPRGHPNDGRAETCQWGPELGLRQRIEAFRRLPLAMHVPHPRIETRSIRRRDWTFTSPMVVRVDGVVVGRTRSLGVTVVPDAALIYT